MKKPPFHAGANTLAVLAYHRTGDPAQTACDPWLFTADADQLDAQLEYFRKHHRVVGLDEALAIASGRESSPGLAVLVTFDDGYVDNFRTALPVLRSHGMEALFFLVSGFASGGIVPWWDRVAWAVKTATPRELRLRGSFGAAAFKLVALTASPFRT